jgi:hypothetical protein
MKDRQVDMKMVFHDMIYTDFDMKLDYGDMKFNIPDMNVEIGVMKSMQGDQQTRSFQYGLVTPNPIQECCACVCGTHIFRRKQPKVLGGPDCHHVPPPAAPVVLQLCQQVHFAVTKAQAYFPHATPAHAWPYQ